MHNFELSDDATMIQETVRKFVQDHAEPKALEHDEHGQFVREGFDAIAELGLFGLAVSEDGGGAGLGMLTLAVATEELARGCASTARLFATQAGACAAALDGLETGADLLETVMMGGQVVPFVGPEAKIVASAAGALTGRAELVIGAAEAGSYLVAAVFDDGEAGLFHVAADAVAMHSANALGFRAAGPASVAFDAAAAAELARGTGAASAIERAGFASLIGAAALAVGQGSQSIELGRRHAAERIAFGKPLVRQQAVGHKLVESRRQIEAARHLVWHAARLRDSDEPAVDVAMLARLSAVEAAVFAADESIQVHGGYGYTAEYHVERHYRDAKTLEVLDGGPDVLRDALARSFAPAGP